MSKGEHWEIAPLPVDPFWGSGSPTPVPAPRPPHRLRVDSPRHSLCLMPMDELDWSNWWVGRDRETGEFYLLVLDTGDATMVGVWCRRQTVGVAMVEGELCWLVAAAQAENL